MSSEIRAGWLSAGAYAGIFVFGIVMALLGAVLPVISSQIGFDLGQAGNLFLVMNSAMLVSMLSLGILTDRFGAKPVLGGGPLFVAAVRTGDEVGPPKRLSPDGGRKTNGGGRRCVYRRPPR